MLGGMVDTAAAAAPMRKKRRRVSEVMAGKPLRRELETFPILPENTSLFCLFEKFFT
jgi:hypothetical protein